MFTFSGIGSKSKLDITLKLNENYVLSHPKRINLQTTECTCDIGSK